jgi:hypothetical protein
MKKILLILGMLALSNIAISGKCFKKLSPDEIDNLIEAYTNYVLNTSIKKPTLTNRIITMDGIGNVDPASINFLGKSLQDIVQLRDTIPRPKKDWDLMYENDQKMAIKIAEDENNTNLLELLYKDRHELLDNMEVISCSYGPKNNMKIDFNIIEFIGLQSIETK